MMQQKRQRGQALVEYAMVTLLIAGVFMVINSGVKMGIGKLWKHMARNVAAGCAGCEPPSEMQ